MSAGVYSITHKVSGKMYIGQSVNIEERIKTHFRNAEKGVNHPLYDSIRKRSKELFLIDTLVFVDCANTRGMLEIEWIRHKNSQFPNGFNLNAGGLSPNNGRVISVDERKRISEGVRRSRTPEILKKIGDAARGRKHSESAKAKMSQRLKASWAKKDSEQRKAIFDKISVSAAGKKVSTESKRKMSESAKMAWAKRKGDA